MWCVQFVRTISTYSRWTQKGKRTGFFSSLLQNLAARNEIQQFIEEQRLPIKSSAKIHTKGGVRNSAEKVEEYFSALTAHQVKGLGDIYKYDFQMFGYDYQRYLRNISL